MKYSQEQGQAIQISKDSNRLSMNAFAGCGKSTTLYGIAEANPKIHYLLLVFSKALQLEAEKTIKKKNLKNVTPKTTHSLAYGAIVFPNGYKVRNKDYKAYDILNHYKGKKIAQYQAFLALSVVNKYFNNDDTAYIMNIKNYEYLHDDINVGTIKLANNIIKDMRDKKLDCTHSFYLKEFQLKVVNEGVSYKKYQGVMLDEAQDTNLVTKSIFDSLDVKKKVKVGDKYQGIYGWRDAVNIMEEVDGWDEVYLTTSYRLPTFIAKKASNFLNVFRAEEKPLNGIDKEIVQSPSNSKVIITRTNSGMIKYIDMMSTKGKTFKTIRSPQEIFGTATDLINIMNKRQDLVQNKSLLQLEDLHVKHNEKLKKNNRDGVSFVSYIDREYEEIDREAWSAMKQIVNYGSARIFELKSLATMYHKDSNLKPNLYFTTAHTSKGLEWDDVLLGDDFVDMFELAYRLLKKYHIKSKDYTYETYVNILKKYKNEELIFDEMNLFYVAMTRAKNTLKIDGSNRYFIDEHTNLDSEIFMDYLQMFARKIEDEEGDVNAKLEKALRDEVGTYG